MMVSYSTEVTNQDAIVGIRIFQVHVSVHNSPVSFEQSGYLREQNSLMSFRLFAACSDNGGNTHFGSLFAPSQYSLLLVFLHHLPFQNRLETKISIGADLI